MQKYIFPPTFDFVTNLSIDSFAMYIFEFEHTLTRKDLQDIWQNLPPQMGVPASEIGTNQSTLSEGKTFETAEASITHPLLNSEMLGGGLYANNGDSYHPMQSQLRWMIFKVKQRGQTNYWDEIASQVNRANANAASKQSRGKKSRQSQKQKRQETREKAGGAFSKRSEGSDDYELNFNWPYDYVSFVEMVKIEAEVLYSAAEEETEEATQAEEAPSAPGGG